MTEHRARVPAVPQPAPWVTRRPVSALLSAGRAAPGPGEAEAAARPCAALPFTPPAEGLIPPGCPRSRVARIRLQPLPSAPQGAVRGAGQRGRAGRAPHSGVILGGTAAPLRTAPASNLPSTGSRSPFYITGRAAAAAVTQQRPRGTCMRGRSRRGPAGSPPALPSAVAGEAPLRPTAPPARARGGRPA